MKILFVTDLIPIDEKENCAKALVPIVKELSLVHQVDVVRPNFLLNSFIRGKIIKPEGYYNFDGIRIRNLNFYSPFLFGYGGINIGNYDEIIAHMPSGILFVQRLLKSVKKERPKLTYAVHQSDIEVMNSFIYSIYFKKALKNAYLNADRIICRAPHLKDKLLKILPECFSKIEVKVSKIPLKYFVSDEFMYSKINAYEKIKFITAANLIKRKNIDLILKALVKFRAYNFSLDVIGDGPKKKSLIKLCNQLRLEDKVRFYAKMPQDELIDKMKEANVFILPSVNETLGLVYLEASASGCLCIGTKGTGIDGVLHDNINCFLCEPSVDGVSRVIAKVFKLTAKDFENLLQNRVLADIK